MTDMPFTMEDLRRTGAKKRDAWWTVFVVDPVAGPIALLIANRTKITPNQITVASFALGLGAAFSFAFADYPALVLGAVLYYMSFVLDCVDGTVEALRNKLEAAGGVGFRDRLEVRPGQRAEHFAMSGQGSAQLCRMVAQLDEPVQCAVVGTAAKQLVVDRVDSVLHTVRGREVAGDYAVQDGRQKDRRVELADHRVVGKPGVELTQ